MARGLIAGSSACSPIAAGQRSLGEAVEALLAVGGVFRFETVEGVLDDGERPAAFVDPIGAQVVGAPWCSSVRRYGRAQSRTG